jgi:hypothetical protein
MNHRWPAFQAWPKEDHANDFLLFVIPKHFLSCMKRVRPNGIPRFGS